MAVLGLLALGAALIAGAFAAARGSARAARSARAAVVAQAVARRALARAMTSWSAADDSLGIGAFSTRAYAESAAVAAGFGRRSGASAPPLVHALRRRRGGARAVGARVARATARTRAARARPDDRLHHRATNSSDCTVGERRSVLIARATHVARGRSTVQSRAAGDDRHIASEPLLPSAQSGRVTGTSDRTQRSRCPRTGRRSQSFFDAKLGWAAM